jgi:hypothetical protein
VGPSRQEYTFFREEELVTREKELEAGTRLLEALQEIDPEYLAYMRKRVLEQEDLWLLRALIGENLPQPMDFEMLKQYAKDVGLGFITTEELESTFLSQMEQL